VAQLQSVTHVLGDGHVRPQSIRLKYHCDIALIGRQPGGVTAADRYAGACQRNKAADRPQQGGLAATGRAQQSKKFAACSGERDTIEHAMRVVVHPSFVDFE
jgi:hypothetical protein